jgi:hypothetical protein
VKRETGKQVPYQTQPWPLLPQQVIGVGIVGLGYEFRVWKRYNLQKMAKMGQSYSSQDGCKCFEGRKANSSIYVVAWQSALQEVWPAIVNSRAVIG